MPQGRKKPSQIDQIVAGASAQFLDEEADRQGVPRDFARKIAGIESSGRADVISGQRQSSAGAVGKMQLMPGTARDLGVNPNHLEQNVQGGVRYLRQQLDAFGGDQRKAAAAYNAGPGAVRKYGGVPPYPETQKYAAQFPAGGESDIDRIVRSVGQTAQPEIEPSTIRKAIVPGRQQTTVRGPVVSPGANPFSVTAPTGFERAGQQVAARTAQISPEVVAQASRRPVRGGLQRATEAVLSVAQPSLTPLPRPVREAVSQLRRSAMTGTVGIAQGAANLVDLVDRQIGTRVGIDPTSELRLAERLKPYTDQVRAGIEARTPIDPSNQGWITAKIPSAVGSAIPFVVGGALGMGAKGAALIGAAMNTDQIVREMDDAGVDPSKRDRAIAVAGATGLTEAIGIGRALDKVGLKRAFIKRLLDIGEEAGQEAAQEYLNNVNAAMVGGYDPNRPLSRGVVESAVLGGIVGGGVQGVGAMGTRHPTAPKARVTPQSPIDIPVYDDAGEVAGYDRVDAPLTPDVVGQGVNRAGDLGATGARRGILREPNADVRVRPRGTAPMPIQNRLAERLQRPQLPEGWGAEPVRNTAILPAESPSNPLAILQENANEAKINAAQFEQSGDWESAQREYDVAHKTLVEAQRQMRRVRSQTPASADELSAIAREISGAALNRNRASRSATVARREQGIAGRQARKAQDVIENAPTAEIPQVPPETNPLLKSVVNPEGGIPAVEESPSGLFGQLARRQAADQAKPARGAKDSGQLSAVEYLKRASGGNGIRVSDRGEASVLGAREAGIVGLTNRASKYAVSDAQVMLDEGGFSLPDGRKFTDPSVTENDVLAFLAESGREGRMNTRDLEQRIEREAAEYEANRPTGEAKGRTAGPTPDRIRQYGRGKNGRVKVVFPDADHAGLAALPNRPNDAMARFWANRLAKVKGWSATNAQAYADQIRREIADLPEGATYEAPAFNPAGEVRPASPKAVGNLPDYAQRAITETHMERKTNYDVDPHLLDAQWEETSMPLASLRQGNETLWQGKSGTFTHRGSMTSGAIVIDRSGQIIDGNNRAYEAIQRGDKEISVLRPATSERSLQSDAIPMVRPASNRLPRIADLPPSRRLGPVARETVPERPLTVRDQARQAGGVTGDLEVMDRLARRQGVERPRDYAERTSYGEPGSGASLSQYADMMRGNRAAFDQLRQMNVDSVEAGEIIARIEDYNEKHNVAPRHLENELNTIRGEQAGTARRADLGIGSAPLRDPSTAELRDFYSRPDEAPPKSAPLKPVRPARSEEAAPVQQKEAAPVEPEPQSPPRENVSSNVADTIAEDMRRLHAMSPAEVEKALTDAESRRNEDIRNPQMNETEKRMNRDLLKFANERRHEMVRAKQLPAKSPRGPARGERPTAKEAAAPNPLEQDVTILSDEDLAKRIRDAETILNRAPDLPSARRNKVEEFRDRAILEKDRRQSEIPPEVKAAYKSAEDRMSAASDQMRALRPSASDWMTPDESRIIADRSPVRSQGVEREAAKIRVAAKRKERARTVSHSNPAIDGQLILATTADGRVIVANEGNKSGVSVVKDSLTTEPKPDRVQQSRTVRVGDDSIDLTPEQSARWEKEVDEPLRLAKERYDYDIALARKAPDRVYAARLKDQAEKDHKAAGMQIASIKRQIAGKMTPKESAEAARREASNYSGKDISVRGVNGKVAGTAFGKVKVKLEDGKMVTVDRDQIAPPVKYTIPDEAMPELNPNRERGAKTRADVENSPEFKKWFGDSKVVDDEGKPLVVYHGTKADFTEFQTGRNKAEGEDAIFFSPDTAIGSRYTGFDPDGNFRSPEIGSVMPVYLHIKNPKIVDFEGGKYGRKEAIAAAKAEGKDGVIFRNHYDAGGVQDQYAVFSPEQIKSATGNRGTFDPNDANMTRQRGNQPPPMPDRVTARDLADNIRAEYRPAKNRPGTVYLNDWGLEALNAADYLEFRAGREGAADDRITGGVNYPPEEARQIADHIRERAGRPNFSENGRKNLETMARQIELAADDGNVSFVPMQGQAMRQARQTIRHEAFHSQQSAVHPDVHQLTTPRWLRAQRFGAAIGEELSRRGYSERQHPAEAAAFVASGNWDAFGMSRDDARQFLTDYFDDVAYRHGKEAISKFRAIHPALQEVVEARRGTNEPRFGSPGLGRSIGSAVNRQRGVERPGRLASGGGGSLRSREAGPVPRRPTDATVRSLRAITPESLRAGQPSEPAPAQNPRRQGLAGIRAEDLRAPGAPPPPTPQSPREPVSGVPTGKDVSGFDYLRSRLSNLNFTGTYERLAGARGREASEIIRNAQVEIARQPDTERASLVSGLRRQLQPFKAEFRDNGQPGLANWMDEHVNAINDADAAFKGLAGFLRGFHYNTKLRYNPKSAALNSLQPLQTLWPHVTTREFAKLMKDARTPSIRGRVLEIAERESGGQVEEVSKRGRFEAVPKVLRNPFAVVSDTNRVVGHLAGEMFADRMGLTGHAKARMAADWAKKIEYDNSRWDVPPLFSGRLAGVVGQFKSFTVKNLERLHADWKAAPEGSGTGNLARRAKMITGQVVLGGVRSVPGVKQIGGVIVLGALARAFNSAGLDDDDANKAAEAVYFGAPGLIEQDISSSMMILDAPFGNTPAEQAVNYLGGPTLSLIVKAFKEGETMIDAEGGRGSTAGEKRKAAAIRLAKATTPYAKTVEAAADLVQGKRPALKLERKSVPMTNLEVAGKLGMATPLRQSKFYEEKDAYDWQKRVARKLKPAQP